MAVKRPNYYYKKISHGCQTCFVFNICALKLLSSSYLPCALIYGIRAIRVRRNYKTGVIIPKEWEKMHRKLPSWNTAVYTDDTGDSLTRIMLDIRMTGHFP
jgi:hypothetical protein